jgi:MYXO-CTERM domain-containing protein
MHPTSPFVRLGLILLAGTFAWALPGEADAATPTYYNNQVTFQAGLTNSVTDPYSDPGYVFIQNNAVMSAVLGETDYESTGHINLNIVSGGYYCSGCNGSFRISFLTTSVGTAQGVDAVGFTIPAHAQVLPYFAYITFADGDTANVQLPAAGNFWGVSAPQQIANIHIGLSMGGTTTDGSFGMDNLTIGGMGVIEPECMVDAECPSDMDACTDEICDSGFCDSVFNQAPCDDADACTELDTCSMGECAGTDMECNDQNICSMDSCDSQIGCINDPIAACCTSDEDCMEGEICLFGSNSCIPDPDPDTGTDTTTDTTDDGESTESEGETTDDGESTESEGETTTDDGESDGSGESDGDSETSAGGSDEIGDDALDTFGGSETDEGCGCTADERGGGALAGLLGLVLLAGVRRRRD